MTSTETDSPEPLTSTQPPEGCTDSCLPPDTADAALAVHAAAEELSRSRDKLASALAEALKDLPHGTKLTLPMGIVLTVSVQTEFENRYRAVGRLKKPRRWVEIYSRGTRYILTNASGFSKTPLAPATLLVEVAELVPAALREWANEARTLALTTAEAAKQLQTVTQARTNPR